MPKHGDMSAGDRTKEAISHLLRVLLEMGMDTGNHQIHFVEHIAGEVELSIGKNVYLDAGKYLDAFAVLVRFANLADML